MRTGQVWSDYLAEFDYFNTEEIRPGCEPRILLNKSSDRALVLVHGLTDSPYYLVDLARFFHGKLGYSVFLPLLQGHGLSQIRSMRGVLLDEWKRNVAFSIDVAKQHGQVAIGGLSTGASLSLWAKECLVDVQGPLFLFSTAIRLGDSWFGFLKQWILTTPFVDLIDRILTAHSLVGKHPYRYCRMDLSAARELVKLITEISSLYDCYGSVSPLPFPVFSARVEGDRVVSSRAIEEFFTATHGRKIFRYRLQRNSKVSHAGLVLAKDICAAGDQKVVLEKGNPFFSELVEAIAEAHKQMISKGNKEMAN